MIDTSFVSYSDAIGGKDPDTYSPTLRDYHCLLWSKQLPCGKSFDLVADAAPPFYLHHSSKLGTFRLSSDCIVHTYSRRKSMLPIIEQFAEGEIRAFWDLGSTVGARAANFASLVEVFGMLDALRRQDTLCSTISIKII